MFIFMFIFVGVFLDLFLVVYSEYINKLTKKREHKLQPNKITLKTMLIEKYINKVYFDLKKNYRKHGQIEV